MKPSISYSSSAIETAKPQTNRLDVLIAMRAIACFFVVVAHCSPPRSAVVYQGYDLSWLFFAAGGAYLRTFFCLSGYLMGKLFYTGRYQLSWDGILKFWRNRVLRVFPLYFFAVLILVVFVYTDLLKQENWGYLVRICTFTYNHALPVDFNGPLWSLSTEVQFYLLVPFIYGFVKDRYTKPRQIFMAVGAVILFVTLLRLLFWVMDLRSGASVISYWYTPLVSNLDMFMCGFFLNPLIQYQKEQKQRKMRSHLQEHVQDSVQVDSNGSNGSQKYKLRLRLPDWWGKFAAVSLAIAFHFYSAYHIYHNEMRNIPGAEPGIRTANSFFILPIITALIAALLIYCFEAGSAYQGHLDNEKFSIHACIRNPIRLIEVFGYLSYGIYVWHMPIIRRITPLVTSQIPLELFFIKVGTVMFLCTLVATVTFYLVELPATRWRFVGRS
ncbi:acyltransferase family protein [Pseudanabaena sp. PCC 6802]|uniref:acyltransferase family protein n=1 Tax=Pseudanabaena sp. PCC 6802 TaxID=118173 RepID=UPI000346A47B|nr:acyltransferase [Pseudanabaena sp. PCC 6802]